MSDRENQALRNAGVALLDRAEKAEARVAQLEAAIRICSGACRNTAPLPSVGETPEPRPSEACMRCGSVSEVVRCGAGPICARCAPSYPWTNEAPPDRADLLDAMGHIIEICAPDLDGTYDRERQLWEVEQLARGALSPKHQFVPYPGPRPETALPRRPTIDEALEYAERRERACIEDGAREAAAAYSIMADYLRNARYDVASETGSKVTDGWEKPGEGTITVGDLAGLKRSTER